MTDEELMFAICNGDQSAYRTIVTRHIKAVSHYAYRLLGNSKDTEDIVQEAFLKLWINANKWRASKSKVSTWLHRIVHNLCIDYLRKHSRVTTRDNFDEEQESVLFASADDSKEQADSAKLKILNTAMKQLPEAQRSALTLCHYQGFSNKEAADIMNLSLKALESALARAKRSLRQMIVNQEMETNNSSSEKDRELRRQESR